MKLHTLPKKAILIGIGGLLLKFAIILLLTLTFSSVFALNFDDITTYDKVSDTITLKNSFGLGANISAYKLISNTYQSLIKGAFEVNVTLYYDGMLTEGIKFYDENGKEISIRNFEVFEWVASSETKEVDNSTTTCKDITDEKTGNLTQDCTTTKATINKTFDTSSWKAYDYEYRKASKEDYRLKVEGNKLPFQSVDWSLTMKGGEETKKYWAWWSSNWSYYKRINITDTSNQMVNLTSVVQIVVPYDSDMQTDFDDIRFVNAQSGLELDYFLGGKIDSQNATFFVEIGSVNNSGITPIDMYYGNPSVSSTSNGTNTFIFYEPFESDLSDRGWTNEGYGTLITNVSHSGSGSVLINGGTSPTNALTYDITNGLYSFSWFAYIGQDSKLGFMGGDIDDITYDAILTAWDMPSTIFTYYGGFEPSSYTTSQTFSVGQWIQYITTTNRTHIRQGTSNSSANLPQTSHYNATDTKDKTLNNLFMYDNSDAGKEIIDDLMLYPALIPEPTYIFGAETSGDSAPTITQNQPVNYYNSSSNSITLNCSAEDNQEVKNMSLNINGSLNEFFNRGSTNITSFQTSKTLNDALYNWSCSATDNLSVTTTSSIRYFTIDTIKPAVSIIAPTNTYYSANQTILNYSVYDLHNSTCWYTNETTTTLINCGLTNWTIITHEGWNNLTLYANDSFSWQNQTSVYFNIDTTTPTINITYPINETYYYIVTALNYTYVEANPSSCWYSINNGATNTSITCGQNVTSLLSAEGNNTFHIWINDTSGRIAYNNVTFVVDAVPPVIVLYSPTNNSNKIIVNSNNYNTTLNYSASDLHLDTCWYSSDYNTSNNSFTCNTLVTIPYTTLGSHYINYNANDSNGNTTSGVTYFSIYQSNYTQGINSNSTLEGMQVIFYLNVTTSNNPITTAKLTYNNIAYTPDTSELRNSTNVFIHHLNLPAGSGNSTGKDVVWFWNYTLASIGSVNTTQNTLKVYSVEIDNCSTYTLAIMNVSLLDEETNTLMVANSTRIEADISLRLPTGSVVWNLNHTYYNVTKLSFCTPSYIFNYSDFKLYSIFGYDGTLYTNEFYYIDGKTLNNTEIPVIVELRDLLLSDSTSFLFFFQNEYNLKKPNVVVEVLRQYIGDGLFRIAEREKTDDNGQTNVHMVEEDVIYRFKIYENEVLIYTSTDYKAVCQQIPCELTLRQKPDSLELGENGLIPYSFHISKDDSARTLSVTFNLDSTETMNLTLYEINYSNNNYIPLVSETLTASSGIVTATLPVAYQNNTIAYKILKTNDSVSDAYVDAGEVTFSETTLSEIMADLVWLFVILIISLFVGIGASEGVLHFVLIGVAFLLLAGLSLLSLWATIPLLLILIGVVIWYHKYKNE